MAEKMTLFCVKLQQTPIPLVVVIVAVAVGNVGGSCSFGQWAQSVQLINIRSKQVHIGLCRSATVLSIARSAIIVWFYLSSVFLIYFFYTYIFFHAFFMDPSFGFVFGRWHCKLSNRYAVGESGRSLGPGAWSFSWTPIECVGVAIYCEILKLYKQLLNKTRPTLRRSRREMDLHFMQKKLQPKSQLSVRSSSPTAVIAMTAVNQLAVEQKNK